MNLYSLLHPKSIAIIGASADKKKLGWQILNNLISDGYKGKIFPINLNEKKIAELITHESILKIKYKVDLAIIVIPALCVNAEIINCAKAGIKNIIIISAGFSEESKKGREREEEITKLAKQHKLNILGPNCLGLINSSNHINATFAKSRIKPGKIAFVSQSGAICSAVLDWAQDKNIGFSKFISLGNKAVINENDLFEYFKNDKETNLIVTYLEEVSNGRELMKTLSRLTKIKPVAILKGGRSLAGSQAAMSHTGSLAGSNIAFITGVKRAGVIIIDNLEEMFNLIKFYERPFKIKNENIYIISNAGGPMVSTIDLLSDYDLQIGKLKTSTEQKLLKILPSIVKIKNPMDIIGDADSVRYAKAINGFLQDQNVENLLILLTPQSSTEIIETAQVIIDISRKFPQKNIFTSFIGGESIEQAKKILEKNQIPFFEYPNQAISIMAKLIKIKNECISHVYNYNTTKNIFEEISKQLDYIESFKILKKYGIKSVLTKKISSENDFLNFTYPIVLKMVGPKIIHKTDKNSIALDIADKTGAIKIWKKFINDFSDQNSYCIGQNQIKKCFELILGFKRDKSFGPIILVGAGGIYTEILKDTNTEVDDIDYDRAINLISKLRIFPILKGARGKKPLAVKSLAEAIVKLAKLARERGDIKELDINPLFINEDGIVAADVRIIV